MTSHLSPSSLYNIDAPVLSPSSALQSAIHSMANGTGNGVSGFDELVCSGEERCAVVCSGLGIVVYGRTEGRELENGIDRWLCALLNKKMLLSVDFERHEPKVVIEISHPLR